MGTPVVLERSPVVNHPLDRSRFFLSPEHSRPETRSHSVSPRPPPTYSRNLEYGEGKPWSPRQKRIRERARQRQGGCLLQANRKYSKARKPRWRKCKPNRLSQA